jgi:hypothetical protein
MKSSRHYTPAAWARYIARDPRLDIVDAQAFVAEARRLTAASNRPDAT